MVFVLQKLFVIDFDIVQPLQSLAASFEEDFVLVPSCLEANAHLFVPETILVLIFLCLEIFSLVVQQFRGSVCLSLDYIYLPLDLLEAVFDSVD
jgi:hypothetical protein